QAAAGQSKPTKTPDHPKPNGLPLYMNFPRTALRVRGEGGGSRLRGNPTLGEESQDPFMSSIRRTSPQEMRACRRV
ncbi:hypothetical protein, partial [Sinorhizobium meliloti]|uniref:hypothetical protein n=1 Tax=Rhizobium meliloti TaxID=382 RepID=UPI001AEC7C32